jgi:hypothetical protein
MRIEKFKRYILEQWIFINTEKYYYSLRFLLIDYIVLIRNLIKKERKKQLWACVN